METENKNIIDQNILGVIENIDFDTARRLLMPDFERIPVDIETFLMGEEYLWNTAGSVLRPLVKEDLIEFFDNEYYIAIFEGSIGYGKSFFVECALCYEIYFLSCLKNPQAFMELAPGTNIFLITIADKEDNARDKIFNGVKVKIQESPYFQKYFPFNPKKTSSLEFPKNIIFKYQATSRSGPVSKDIFSTAYDEINFLPVVKGSARNRRRTEYYDMAQNLVDSSERRMKSRFMDSSGKMIGKMYIIGQSEFPDDYTQRKAIELAGGKDKLNQLSEKGVLYRKRATWETRGIQPGEKTFKVQIPRADLASEMKLSRSDLKILKDDEIVKPGCNIMNVPEQWRSMFEGDGVNLEDAVLQLGGIRISEIGGDFIGEIKWDYSRRHPANNYETTLDDLVMDWSYLCKQRRDGIWVPRLRPDIPRFIHIDASLGVEYPFGFVMVHPIGISSLKSLDAEDEDSVSVHVCVDIALRIKRNQNKKISFRGVRKLIFDISKMGFDIMGISFDQYQAESFKQPLENKGFYVEEISMESSIVPYRLLQSAIDENRWNCYYHPMLAEEFRNLQLISEGRRYKVITRKYKDVADCCAGTMKAIQNALPDLTLPTITIGMIREKQRAEPRNIKPHFPNIPTKRKEILPDESDESDEVNFGDVPAVGRIGEDSGEDMKEYDPDDVIMNQWRQEND